MAFGSIKQTDFGGGIYQTRIAPKNTVYDAQNLLIDDEGHLFKRGCALNYSNADVAQPIGVASIYFPGPKANRVLAWDNTRFNAFNSSGIPTVVATITDILGRPASVGGISVFPIGSTGLLYYAGSLKTANYTTGTMTLTNGSAAVTGSGTAFVANIDPGMMFGQFVVASVTDDTHLTLTTPWVAPTATISTLFAHVVIESFPSMPLPMQSLGKVYVAAAGSGLPRLIMATGNRAYLSDLGIPTQLNTLTYHELPSNAIINGAEGYGDSCVLFTNVGVWRIDNLSLEIVDAVGNIQQTVEQISKDLILWGDLGIDAWKGDLIVPALDDIQVMGLNGSASPITAGDNGHGAILEKIRPLYRQYVAAGYTPGMGAVYHGHYFLPILDVSTITVIDVLVCRLDRGAAWTRWSGPSAGPAFAVRAGGADVPTPKLMSLAGLRVTDATGCLTPTSANAKEVDASAPFPLVITNDYQTSQTSQPGTVDRVRATYVMANDGAGSTPEISPNVSSDEDGGNFSALPELGPLTGWVESDGTKYSWGRVTQKRQRIRFQLEQLGATASYVLREIEVLIRGTGKL